MVSGNKIKGLEKGFVAGTDADSIVDLRSKTVLPGFINMHVHIDNESSPSRYLERFTKNDVDIAFQSTVYAKRTLLAGFTTVSDLGGSGVNIALGKAINSGVIMGPRIFTAGKAIATMGGHADPTNGVRKENMEDPGPKEGVINSPEDARKAVRQQ